MSPKILSILLADDEPIVRKTIGDYLRESGHQVQEVNNGTIALQCIGNQDYDLALIDIRMPGMDGLVLLQKAREIRPELSVVLITAHGNMEIAIEALRSGAADFLTKPIKLLELDAVLEKSIQIRALRQERRHLHETIRGIQVSDDLRSGNRNLLGNSEATRKVREQIRQVVEAGLETILLTGETGTGKEVVAREIHSLANLDKSSPFIAVSCPALPDSLVESELFGHVKGTFTGAIADRAGYFELADGGTLFLDEVADLELIEQVLINLMLNAIQAVQDLPNPKIELLARMDEKGRIIIQVVDNGPGIIEEVQAKIFIPFFTTKKSGSGIGLSLSRQIMRLHRGTISVQSKPNIETVFTLRF